MCLKMRQCGQTTPKLLTQTGNRFGVVLWLTKIGLNRLHKKNPHLTTITITDNDSVYLHYCQLMEAAQVLFGK